MKIFRYACELILTLLAVFFFTTLILHLVGAPPFEAYYHIVKGSLGSWVKVAHVITTWIPLTLCACGLLYTFRIGLWNIGIEGQMMMGAVFTTFLLRFGVESDMPVFFLTLSFIAGAIGGAVWAMIAGSLKTKGGVNEIFAGLGLNFVAQGLILWLIFGPWKRPGIASMSGTELFPPKLWLSYLSFIRLSPAGLFLALIAIGVTAFMLRYARIGLSLRAIGNNPHAAYLFGLKPDRYMLLAMIFAGGFAGLAGSIQVTGIYHRLLPAISGNYGYLALLVVMLANYNVRIVPAVAFFFACLNIGSIQLPMVLQLDSSLSGVIQGTLVLATLAVHAWRNLKLET
ncbi:ABC transporter permease [Desulfonema magnum]|uniref:Branched-chain amino acid ABC transporter, permease protein n=1 Tax=Desulfonema magnum TaxID=45655 RepID=A0A975BUT6_9BACT|nr:ABC transporter permease [Desulfonema magnum]QTA92225.1 Branched-chain amino acid ABC transporter, permease protein [Desulfonema magnum]